MSDTHFWDRAAPKYARDPISDPAAYEATLTRMRQILQPHHRVLEIGCGTGSTALELAPGVAEYHATDLSPGMIRIARDKLGADGPDNLTFEPAPAGDLPDGPFDAVLALNLLHLVPDLEEVIARIFRTLPPGGVFLSKTALLRDGAFYLPWLVRGMRLVGKAPTVRMLREGDLTAALTEAGFRLDETLLQPGMAPRLFVVARKP